ncbi:oxidoreductase [Streptomyces sp. NBRC 110611]|uniref:C-terminal binding protein n=1 Tax=Streptomyces sp. NBRC 110611 TaxID=1621259 RepID=UPI0008585802|nr:C-terminal binding protein [Streptomyces sp. NBRC 110611]GAU65765.1 oxidoreductase [Streptomyces sp. NBRC 110611]
MTRSSVSSSGETPPRNRPSVVVLDAPGAGYVEGAGPERDIISPLGAVRPVIVPAQEHGHLHELDADYVILWHRVSLNADFFTKSDTCRAVVCASVGYDHVDIEAARAHGIPVYHVPHYGTEEVADHTLALFLALERRLGELRRHVSDGGWDWRAIGDPRRLRDMVWGVVGLGRIGLAVARRAQAFGLRVVFVDPYNHPGIEKALGMERRHHLDQLLEESDVVSLHVPLTAETRHLLDARRLHRMKRGSVLVNTARGGLIDISALEGALAEERPARVGLDVVEGEPDIPPWLRDHPRALISPHAAFYSVPSLAELRARAAEAVRQMISGEPVTAAVAVP